MGGAAAFAGFTGGTGDYANLEDILNFSFSAPAGDPVDNRILGNSIFANGGDTPTPDGKLRFDGSSYVSLPNDLIQNATQAQTIEAWFETASGGVILGYQLNDPSSPTDYYYESVPTLYVGIDGRLYGGFGYGEFISAGIVADGTWHHAAWTSAYNNGWRTVSLYLDGQFVGSKSQVNPDTAGSFNQIGTGHSNGTWPGTNYGWFGFQGQIDDVQIWNVVRTALEIQRDSTGSLEGNEPGLAAYYRFDEASGTTAQDSTPNHRDGVLASAGGSVPVRVTGLSQAIDLGGDGVTYASWSTPDRTGCRAIPSSFRRTTTGSKAGCTARREPLITSSSSPALEPTRRVRKTPRSSSSRSN